MKNYYSDIEKILSPVKVLDVIVDNPNDGITVPVYPKDPVLDPPILPDDPGDGSFRSFKYYGYVYDADSGQPIPGASVVLYANGKNLGGAAAGNDGYFELYSKDEAESITVTSVGYQGKNFPATLIKHDFPLMKKEVDLPPVVVTAPKKKDYTLWWLLIGGIVLYKVTE